LSLLLFCYLYLSSFLDKSWRLECTQTQHSSPFFVSILFLFKEWTEYVIQFFSHHEKEQLKMKNEKNWILFLYLSRSIQEVWEISRKKLKNWMTRIEYFLETCWRKYMSIHILFPFWNIFCRLKTRSMTLFSACRNNFNKKEITLIN